MVAQTPARRSLKIFLCHCSHDQSAVRELYFQLKKDGFKPWLDKVDLIPGQDFSLVIQDAVRASRVVLVCLSKASVTKEGFVQKEIRLALDVAEEKPEGMIYLIPIRLEPVEVPKRLAQWHWVNLFEQDGYAQICRALDACAASLRSSVPDGLSVDGLESLTENTALSLENNRQIERTPAPESTLRPIDGDPLLRAARRYMGSTPWKLALACCVVGFMAHSLFYGLLFVFDSPLLRRRGLFSYLSATVGDGVLVPIGVAVSAGILQKLFTLLDLAKNSNIQVLQHDSLKTEKRLTGPVLRWIPGSLAIILTVAIHAMWLLDSTTSSNWTLVDGHLNFFGYWHAAFFCLVLWWFSACISRMLIVFWGMSDHLTSPYLARTSLHIWTELNVLLAMLVGFAALLYGDNYGLSFSWRTMLGNVTTLACVISTISAVLAVNCYFLLRIYVPARANANEERRKQLALLARRAWTTLVFGFLLAAALLFFRLLLPTILAWPMASFVAGALIPLLFAENYMADIFWNHGRSPDSLSLLGICAIWAVSATGFLSSLKIALGRSSEAESIMQLFPWWVESAIVSFLTGLVCVVISWLTLRVLPEEYVTDQKPMYNMIQNYTQYWGVLQFFLVPIAGFSYAWRAQMKFSAPGPSSMPVALVLTFIVIVAVLFPFLNNYAHLRDLKKRQDVYVTYHSITGHILFITLFVGGLSIGLLGWLWASWLDAAARLK